MSAYRVALVIVLAGGISIGIAVIGQRWIDQSGKLESVPSIRSTAPLQTLPEFGLPDMNGQEISSTAWADKVVIVNYWASWCPPCVREIALFMQTQHELGESGVQVIGIAVDRLDDVKTFIADRPINYPILIANPEAIALAKRLGNRVEGLPFTVIFDRRGRRVFSRTGEVTATDLKAELDALVPARNL